MLYRFAFGAAAALLLSACAGTTEQAVGPDGQVLAANDPKNKVVCETERSVGSNRPTKICMTVREREMLEQRSRTLVRGDNRPTIKHDTTGR
jgi:hypothetical protein